METFDLVLGATAAVFLGFYLIYALLKPENF